MHRPRTNPAGSALPARPAGGGPRVLSCVGSCEHVDPALTVEKGPQRGPFGIRRPYLAGAGGVPVAGGAAGAVTAAGDSTLGVGGASPPWNFTTRGTMSSATMLM